MHKSTGRMRAVFLMLPVVVALSGCVSTRGGTGNNAGWQQARQMVLVTTADWDKDHGTLRRFERVRSGWRAVGEPQQVMVGKAGVAWGSGLHAAQPDGIAKREGDGRAPAGVFDIGDAFGYPPQAATAMRYLPMAASHYCVDVSDSPLYNQIVDASIVGQDAVAASTEPMRRDIHAGGDQRYQLGFVIAHNMQAQPMGGSCIFAHVWKGPGVSTSGCTAMPAETMRALVQWLRPDQRPVFVLLPADAYLRVRDAWKLPVISATQ